MYICSRYCLIYVRTFISICKNHKVLINTVKMRSSKTSNAGDRHKSSSAQSYNSGKQSIPTPLDFDCFIPWICLQIQAPQYVYISRVLQDDNANKTRRTSATKMRQRNCIGRPEATDTAVELNQKSLVSIQSNTKISSHSAIPIKTYYNTKGNLIGIAIINCPYEISRKIILAIKFCTPFHSYLDKLTISRVKLSALVLYEISKLLTYSNITEVCLNDTYIPEGNYYTLLDRPTVLKRLSLQRCSINDSVCKKIAETLRCERPAANTLQSLNLTSNRLTDQGIIALGDALRSNRRLLHLNLSDNMITDAGVVHLLNHLMPFSLNSEEIRDLKIKRLDFYKQKIEVYKEILEKLNNKKNYENNKENIKNEKCITQVTKLTKPSSKLNKNDASLVAEESSLSDQAEKAAEEIVGKFNYIFDSRNVIYGTKDIVSIGNLKLCYINLSYNNLSYFTVKKIHEVVAYQNRICKPRYQSTGLLRIVLDGNHIPVCKELHDIEVLLANALVESQSISESARNPSSKLKKTK